MIGSIPIASTNPHQTKKIMRAEKQTPVSGGEPDLDNFVSPDWLKRCPIPVQEWVTYRGETYFAVLDWEESERRSKPVFDLAYCATNAMNEIFLLRRCYNKNMKLKVWDNALTGSHLKVDEL